MQQGPWYRAYAAPTYQAPCFLCSGGCATCLLFFGIFFTFAGCILTGVAYRTPSPPFDTPFFTDGNKSDPLRTIGPLLLACGLLFFVVSVVLCFNIAKLSRRELIPIVQERRYGRPPTQSPVVYPHPTQVHSPPESNYPCQPSVAFPRQQYNGDLPPSYSDLHGIPASNSQFNYPSGSNDSMYTIPSAPGPQSSSFIQHRDVNK